MQRTPALVAIAAAISLLATAGCAVTRGQQTPGAYVDDAAITNAVKNQMAVRP